VIKSIRPASAANLENPFLVAARGQTSDVAWLRRLRPRERLRLTLGLEINPGRNCDRAPEVWDSESPLAAGQMVDILDAGLRNQDAERGRGAGRRHRWPFNRVRGGNDTIRYCTGRSLSAHDPG
jgi:hypothetical protein